MNADQFHSLLKDLGACDEGLAWCAGKSLREFWVKSERADWMLWLCGRMVGKKGWPKLNEIVLVACLCAERALPLFKKKYPDDARPRTAIEAARVWANCGGNIEEVRKARRAAAYAAAAYAAAYASAAYAAAYAAAAYAAAYAKAAGRTFGRTRELELREMAVLVRENLAVPE